MKKWYDEEYEFQVEVTGFLRGDHTERYCRNGEEVGDRYTCTYGCPVNQDGQGICSKAMLLLFPLMEAVRSGGDLENVGGSGPYCKDIVANAEKTVPRAWINADGNGLEQPFIDYVLPLIQGVPRAPQEHSLPRYARLKKVLVSQEA